MNTFLWQKKREGFFAVYQVSFLYLFINMHCNSYVSTKVTSLCIQQYFVIIRSTTFSSLVIVTAKAAAFFNLSLYFSGLLFIGGGRKHHTQYKGNFQGPGGLQWPEQQPDPSLYYFSRHLFCGIAPQRVLVEQSNIYYTIRSRVDFESRG